MKNYFGNCVQFCTFAAEKCGVPQKISEKSWNLIVIAIFRNLSQQMVMV